MVISVLGIKMESFSPSEVSLTTDSSIGEISGVFNEPDSILSIFTAFTCAD